MAGSSPPAPSLPPTFGEGWHDNPAGGDQLRAVGAGGRGARAAPRPPGGAGYHYSHARSPRGPGRGRQPLRPRRDRRWRDRSKRNGPGTVRQSSSGNGIGLSAPGLHFLIAPPAPAQPGDHVGLPGLRAQSGCRTATSRWRLSRHARDALHVLRRARAPRAAVVGWSMGVAVGLEMIRAAPARVVAFGASSARQPARSARPFGTPVGPDSRAGPCRPSDPGALAARARAGHAGPIPDVGRLQWHGLLQHPLAPGRPSSPTSAPPRLPTGAPIWGPWRR